jgi:hypothetical protein
VSRVTKDHCICTPRIISKSHLCASFSRSTHDGVDDILRNGDRRQVRRSTIGGLPGGVAKPCTPGMLVLVDRSRAKEWAIQGFE